MANEFPQKLKENLRKITHEYVVRRNVAWWHGGIHENLSN